MKFAYREYVSVFPGTDDYRLILRPVITIRVVGQSQTPDGMLWLIPAQMRRCFHIR